MTEERTTVYSPESINVTGSGFPNFPYVCALVYGIRNIWGEAVGRVLLDLPSRPKISFIVQDDGEDSGAYREQFNHFYAL